MRKRSGIRLWICFAFAFLFKVVLLPGQDVHFTQPDNSPMFTNPALTGVFGGDTRYTAGYRSQWTSVPVDYRTFTASVDHKFFGRRARSGFFAGGLSFHYDRAGTSPLTYLQLALNGSYTQKISSHFYTTVGVQLGGTQRRLDLGNLTFDNQYDPEAGAANLDLDNGENLFDNSANNFFDLSTGINFRWQALDDAALVDRLDKRSSIDFGIGIFHLNQPNQSFIEDAEVALPIRLSIYAMGTAQLAPDFDLMGSFSVMRQKPYNQYLAGLAGRLHLDRSLGKQLALRAGVFYRFEDISDAYSPYFGVDYNSWHFGFSYDINVSEFNVATNRRSGPEFYIRYFFKRVKPMPTFKICPLI